MKKKIFWIITFTSTIVCFYFYFMKEINDSLIKKSIIYNTMKNYSLENPPFELLNSKTFSKGSSEKLFVEGLNYYFDEKYSEAEYKFIKAKSISKDPGIIYYSNLYINGCDKLNFKYRDINFVEEHLNYIQKYKVFSNCVEDIWWMLSSNVSNIQDRKKAIYILKKYIKEAKHLTKENQLKLRVIIRTLEMANQEYGESIYGFYKIIYETNQLSDSSEKQTILIKAYEYIGKMYKILENYDLALSQYDWAINIPISDEEENMEAKYSVYIDKIKTLILAKNYQEAKKQCKIIEKNLKYLSKDIKIDVQVFLHKSYAIFALEEKNYKLAKKYIDVSYCYFGKSINRTFNNSKSSLDLVYFKYLIEIKDYKKAEIGLKKLLENSSEKNLAFKKDVYSCLLKIYEKNKNMEEYFKYSKKLSLLEKNFSNIIQKNYVEFIEKSHNLDVLKEKAKESRIKLTVYGFLIVILITFVGIEILYLIKLKKNNQIDHLTNVYNRKFLKTFLKNIENKNKLINVIMVDIDYFKKYNDRYGHLEGDKVIKNVAFILKKSFGENSFVIRYGGEEFLIFTFCLTKENLIEKLESTRFSLKNKNIFHEDSPYSNQVTLSIGISSKKVNNSHELNNLIIQADEALYTAKKNGRNKYVFYEQND